MSKRGKYVKEPHCVIDYNTNMGGVDLKYQLLNMYLLERKRISRCDIKLFKRI